MWLGGGAALLTPGGAHRRQGWQDVHRCSWEEHGGGAVEGGSTVSFLNIYLLGAYGSLISLRAVGPGSKRLRRVSLFPNTGSAEGLPAPSPDSAPC